MSANLEVSFEWEHTGLMVFTQRVTKENAVAQGNEKYPSWPWADMVQSFGFFQDVTTLVLNEVEQLVRTHPTQRTVTLKLGRGEQLPPTEQHERCANAWVKLEKDLEAGTLTIELHHREGAYSDFVLLDVLDHLEGRAGRGKNRHVDGRPGVLRQKLERALSKGPVYLHDPDVPRKPILDDERVRT